MQWENRAREREEEERNHAGQEEGRREESPFQGMKSSGGVWAEEEGRVGMVGIRGICGACLQDRHGKLKHGKVDATEKPVERTWWWRHVEGERGREDNKKEETEREKGQPVDYMEGRGLSTAHALE